MIKKLFFVGIKGVGMTSLAVLAKEANIVVSGSDVEEEFITDSVLAQHGISYSVGFNTADIDTFIRDSDISEVVVVVTAAHGGLDNPQAVYAKGLMIRILSYGQALGALMDGTIFPNKVIRGISVAGAHGKTTIASFIATSLSLLSYDPSYIVGTSFINPIGAGGHFGRGDYLIAEADEYLSDITYDRTPKFLYQHPEFAIINNIDFDHPDFFCSLDEVRNAYQQFVQTIKPGGILIVNGDDEQIQRLISEDKKNQYITYGQNSGNDYQLVNYKGKGLGSEFEVRLHNEQKSMFAISILGFHNALNALAVIALLNTVGIYIEHIKEVLPQFKGGKRRLEHVGQTKDGIVLFDDYAHHPDEIKSSLRALRVSFPDKKIVCIFQSHTYSRTTALLAEFTNAFEDASRILLLPTFASSRESTLIEDPTRALLEAIEKKGSKVILLPDKSSVVEYVTSNFNTPEYLIVSMGAGDVYKVIEEIKKE